MKPDTQVRSVLKSLAISFAAAFAINAVGAAAPARAELLNAQSIAAMVRADAQLLSIIDSWTIGDEMNYSIALGPFGKIGTSRKWIEKFEGDGVWMYQQMDMMGQKQKVEALIEKSTGKTLKLIVNGKEQQLNDDDAGFEIEEQDFVDITVPAGKFRALHIVAKTKDDNKVEVWMNPTETCIDGTLKQKVEQQGMEIVLELTKFTKK